MADNPLEDIVRKESKKDISLGRIALVTLCYGAIGELLGPEHPYVIAPAMALIGAGASTYDEVKQKGIDLFWPGMGMLVGGIFGSIFDAKDNLPNILTYVGMVVGGGLGAYKSYLNREKKGSWSFDIRV